MANPAFRLHGAGHGVADLLYGDIDTTSSAFQALRSRRPGDGGLELGRLVRVADLEAYAGRPWEEILPSLAGAAEPIFNAGGPALVSLALASQLLRPAKIPVTYFGLTGDDAPASRLRWLLAQTPLDLGSWRQRPGTTDVTWVLSDPRARGGDGERFFVNRPGTCRTGPDALGEPFFQATLCLFAGTALTPDLHAALPDLLSKARRRGAATVAGGAWDFDAEKAGRPWDLGGDAAWPNLDLLVADEAEALAYGRKATVEASVDALLDRGLAAAVVTRGTGPVYFRSVGGLFGESRGEVPVHTGLMERARDRATYPGDTAGAGDNFLGGLLTAFFHQWLSDDFYPKGELHLDRELHHMNPLRLRRAVEAGVVSGGMACLQPGGLKLEKHRGERLAEWRALRAEPAPASLRW
jgi:sugar/nucleoside kinase (ribokinase family)